MQSTTHIVHVSTIKAAKCVHCEEIIGGASFEAGVNHYLDEHEYILLHIGTESTIGPSGKACQATVAVLGN
jgi:hypothetical protein